MFEYKPNAGWFSLWVNGEGVLKAVPDIARVNIGLVTSNKVLLEAQRENTDKMNTIIATLTKAGIPNEYIQTFEYYISPEYNFDNGNQFIIGYRVTHTLQVEIDNIDNIGKYIDSAVSNGANRISNIQFDLKYKQAYELEALKRALINVNCKATTITQTLHVYLYPVPVKVLEKKGTLPESPMLFPNEAVAGIDITPIVPGKLTIRVKIRAQYMYKAF